MKWKAILNDWRIITAACTVAILLLIIYIRKMKTNNKKLPTEWTISENGKKMFVHLEGFRNKAYQDAAGLWTTGIGHLIKAGESDLKTKTLSDTEVWTMFFKDKATAEKVVKSKIKVPITNGLYDALVSLAFNTGTIYNYIIELVNDGDYTALAKRWLTTAITIKKGTVVVQGLKNRRESEVKLFA